MKKTIAVIGAAGKAGSAIAPGLTAAGYRVLLADEIKKRPFLYVRLLLLEYMIKSKCSPVDVEMVLSEREASWEADIIIVAVHRKKHADTACKIKDVVTGKIVIILMNGTLERSATEELARLLPNSKIVNVRHANGLGHWEKSAGDGTINDVVISGNDQDAVSKAMQLLNDSGLHPLRMDPRSQ